jgi:hypothetical protein
VWDGADGTDTGQAVATCGQDTVVAAYDLNPQTQMWSRWFAGRPEVSDLVTVNNPQGILVLGGAQATATSTPSTSVTPPPTTTATPATTPSPAATASPTHEVVVESCIEGEFEGWEGDTLFELCNGQLWIQSSFAYLYHYAYRPDVTIVSTSEGYRMFVEGVSDSILVSQVTDFIRTCIDGEFEGWEGDTVFALCNGQVWQQASYAYTYHYAYRPDVLIYWAGYGYLMQVEGVRDTVEVIRLQ